MLFPVHWATQSPPWQASPLQLVLHVPQCMGLESVSMHWPLHSVSPGRHWHWPPRHISRSAHWLPICPQLSGSFWRSRQLPPSSVRPSVQPHTPDEQTPKLLSQSFPHWPQWLRSVARSTQASPHWVRPGGHAQMPDWQYWPGPQSMPQPPQLSRLVEASRHTPSQAICPAGQAMVLQTPAWQTWLSRQLVPQAPQFAQSLLRSVQLLLGPQATCPMGQPQTPD